jgi:hypothetical protein
MELGTPALQRYGGQIVGRLKDVVIRAGYHSKPSFLIIGAQKAGTTALHRYLAEHPRITPGFRKEIGFFVPEQFADWPEHPNHRILCLPHATAFDDPRAYRRAAAWYHGHFPWPHRLGPESLTFEATPDYLYYPGAAQRILEYEPAMRLIVLLRNPVERAFSAWQMYRNYGTYRPWIYSPMKEDREFDVAAREEIEKIRANEPADSRGYVRRGLYYDQLLPYFERFDPSRICILDSEQLRSDTSSVIDRVAGFLELPGYGSQKVWDRFHVGEYHSEIPDSCARLLEDFYRAGNRKLYELLGRDLGW